jgi:hypothetical protein
VYLNGGTDGCLDVISFGFGCVEYFYGEGSSWYFEEGGIVEVLLEFLERVESRWIYRW